ncbi:hypothetical protein ACLB2K_061397 [Fragaria x ananassa]
MQSPHCLQTRRVTSTRSSSITTRHGCSTRPQQLTSPTTTLHLSALHISFTASLGLHCCRVQKMSQFSTTFVLVTRCSVRLCSKRSRFLWNTDGRKPNGDLLMLAHPLHVKLLQNNVTVLEKFKYGSIDGDLVVVVENSWVLKTPPLPVTWHSIKGSHIDTHFKYTDSYSYGKLIAKAARLALIAEEVDFVHVIPAITKFLKDAIEPWLVFEPNGYFWSKTRGTFCITFGPVPVTLF